MDTTGPIKADSPGHPTRSERKQYSSGVMPRDVNGSDGVFILIAVRTKIQPVMQIVPKIVA
jgi:hypothetical protein